MDADEKAYEHYGSPFILSSSAIYGKIVDPAYTRLLLQNTDIPLHDVLTLDRIQKRLPVDDQVVKRLRKAGWVEGRKPNLHISAEIADATSTRADYIRTRAQDDTHYEKLVIDYLARFEKASRAEIHPLSRKDHLAHG